MPVQTDDGLREAERRAAALRLIAAASAVLMVAVTVVIPILGGSESVSLAASLVGFAAFLTALILLQRVPSTVAALRAEIEIGD